DNVTNVTPRILSHVGRDLHNLEREHPLGLLKSRMARYFHSTTPRKIGSPAFSVHDRLHPVVTVEQNFDSLLVPDDHVSRSPSDCYYINRGHLLRAHMTAHQADLISSGLDNFVIFGDVYRRDEIDSTHYPVFHQADAVSLSDAHQLSRLAGNEVRIFETRGEDGADKQGCHTRDATLLVEHRLKTTLVKLVQTLFGDGVRHRWVDAYFPFTHPSWELEIETEKGQWLEVLGCGVIRHQILNRAGASDRIGWAFGAGLERLAMHLYGIPDIRLFWSTDTGFLSQFRTDDPDKPIVYKPVSVYPQCINDMSFWLAKEGHYEANDFYELAREVGGDLVEQVKPIDEFVHPKTGRKSVCYRIVYRHLERNLTQREVNVVHKRIGDAAVEQLGVVIR
ncbi:hypothetical protein AAG570_005389, partial [Ranatra chinensis]